MSIADKLSESGECLNDYRLKFGIYIALPVYIMYLVFSRQWDDIYLLSCPFLAYAIACLYRKYVCSQNNQSGSGGPPDVYLFILPSIFLVLVTFGYAVFGLDSKSEIYRISFVLVGIVVLWLAASGIFMLVQMIPAKCEICKNHAPFSLSYSEEKSSGTKRFCYTHFAAAFQEAISSRSGYYLFIEPPADISDRLMDHTFYTYDDLIEYEYEKSDIENINKLLEIVKQKAVNDRLYGAVYALIPARYITPESDAEDIQPLFTCDPSDIKLQLMDYRDFKSRIFDRVNRIEEAGGRFSIDVPTANAGIYMP